jgi:predicted RNA binding protein YcfA (HicA-like mRNA interferase family)
LSRLPVVNFRTLERVLARCGFDVVRQKGSHVFFRHANGRTTTAPNHPGRDIAPPLLREILREIDLTPDQFRDELNRR